MNIDELTIGQARQVSGMFQSNCQSEKNPCGLNAMIGEKVIIRTYSAGVWFGRLDQKSGNEVILTDARRMWRWLADRGISLSAVSVYGIKRYKSKIIVPVKTVWLEAIEIIPCTDIAIESIGGAENAEAE